MEFEEIEEKKQFVDNFCKVRDDRLNVDWIIKLSDLYWEKYYAKEAKELWNEISKTSPKIKMILSTPTSTSQNNPFFEMLKRAQKAPNE